MNSISLPGLSSSDSFGELVVGYRRFLLVVDIFLIIHYFVALFRLSGTFSKRRNKKVHSLTVRFFLIGTNILSIIY